MLTLLLISIVTLAFDVQPGRASGTIYIREDGSVEGTDKIQRDGNVYTFTGNIDGRIEVQRDNIVVDGAGYTLQGTGDEDSKGISFFESNIAKNVEVREFGYGIVLDGPNNIIYGNIITNNYEGIGLSGSSNKIYGNNITNNKNDGIDSWHSSNSSIYGNNITNNKNDGIFLDGCSNNNIYGNDIAYNDEGIVFWKSSNNKVYGNNLTRNEIRLDQSSNYNTIFGNNITKGLDSIILFSSKSNIIYHNNFIDTLQVSRYNTSNTWDNGVEGNYWSKYIGVDLDHDGLGDTPHIMDASNTDNHPLMGMFYSFKTSLGYDVNIISNSTIEDFQYFESNNTIKMQVSNTSSTQSFGFCRASLPKGLMSPPYTVIIDDGLTEILDFNDTLYDNSTHRWIYFAYEHSTREVEIHAAPDTTPPTMSILSPENKSYAVKAIPLTYTVSESTSWMAYRLDNKANITITGNTTLSELSDGTHSLIIYAKDTSGNTGASEIIYFSVDTQPELFPSTLEWLIIVIMVIIVIAGTTGFVLYRKRKVSGKSSSPHSTKQLIVIEYKYQAR